MHTSSFAKDETTEGLSKKFHVIGVDVLPHTLFFFVFLFSKVVGK